MKKREISRRTFINKCFCTTAALQPLLFLNGCSKQSKGKPNLILISIDTLRPDHLGCYGYHRNTSPNIDQFAKESLLYSNASAPSSWTLPSHAGMLTGIHPYTYGIHSRRSIIPKSIPLMSEILNKQGYQTAAFVDSASKGNLGPKRGFSRGFDTFKLSPFENKVSLPESKVFHDTAETVNTAQKWLNKRNPSNAFFLFMHTKSVHSTIDSERADPLKSPYDKPESYRSHFLTPEQSALHWDPPYSTYLSHHTNLFSSGASDPRKYPRNRLEALIGQYDGGILYADKYIGKFLKFVKDQGLLDNSVIIITSDHGEAFLEHELFLHSELYNQLTKIPLIVRMPRSKTGKIIDTPTDLLDIVPTFLDIAGITPSVGLDGVVLPQNNSLVSDRSFYSYYLYNRNAVYDGFSLLKKDKKIINEKYIKTNWQFNSYDITSDPLEQNPLPSDPFGLKRDLIKWIKAEPRVKGEEIELDRETLDHLRSLGYV